MHRPTPLLHFRVIFGFLLLGFATSHAFAQTTSTTDGTTPSGIATGAASGSYALSNFDSVNLYNGNLNVICRS